jgi:hypothetical protein
MTMARAKSGRSAVALALAAFAFAPAASRADETQLSLAPPPGAATGVQKSLPPIKIRIAVANASEAEGPVDPGATDIYEHLPARFHSIRLIEERTIEVQFGDRQELALPTGTTVRLIPVAVHAGQLHLQLEIPEVLNTSMRMSNSRAFYVGGVEGPDGTLILKLVPEFSAYIGDSAPRPAAPPQTQPALGRR